MREKVEATPWGVVETATVAAAAAVRVRGRMTGRKNFTANDVPSSALFVKNLEVVRNGAHYFLCSVI